MLFCAHFPSHPYTLPSSFHLKKCLPRCWLRRFFLFMYTSFRTQDFQNYTLRLLQLRLGFQHKSLMFIRFQIGRYCETYFFYKLVGYSLLQWNAFRWKSEGCSRKDLFWCSGYLKWSSISDLHLKNHAPFLLITLFNRFLVQWLSLIIEDIMLIFECGWHQLRLRKFVSIYWGWRTTTLWEYHFRRLCTGFIGWGRQQQCVHSSCTISNWKGP